MPERLLNGQYRIIKVLGAGGFGQTFLAEDTQHPQQRLCVVKQFQPSSREPEFLKVAQRLFTLEVETLRRLGQHNQIPELYNSFEEAGEFYLVQEFIDGHPLSEEFSRVHHLGEPETTALLLDVLSVLDFVHQNQVIHRDIKPSNLIRRRADGKVVLIDFGAVREIHTKLTGMPEQTGLTVGIGTQGYTPSEQLMGRPRYCSDLYALGMTVIQAMTGMPPAQIPEDPQTSNLVWRDRTTVSPGLGYILDCMVRYDYTARYQSAAEVTRAIHKLSELPTNLTGIPPSILMPEAQLNGYTRPLLGMDWRSRLRRGVQVVALVAAVGTGLVLGLRQLGMLESSELRAYDQMTRLMGDRAPDPRLLVVGITEADLQALNRATPSDASIAEAIANLQQLQPRVIGLDLYRDLPQGTGQPALLQQLQAKNLVTIFKLGDANSSKIPPPPGVPAERTGFNDLVLDPDNVIRRNFMLANYNGQASYSFSLQLARQYLSAQKITLEADPQSPKDPRLGKAAFRPFSPTSGGYQNGDDAGYQVLLRYRSSNNLARQVSLLDVLQGKLQPDWVRDKIILIGTVAPSGKDLYYTPFSAGERTDHQMPGVVVHAQMTSQILSTALDGDRLIWYFPNWAEAGWIAVCAIAGATITWFIRHPLVLGSSILGAIVVVVGTSVVLFTQQGWLPVVAPLVALLLAGTGGSIYRAYWDNQQQKAMATMLWNGGSDKTMTISPTSQPSGHPASSHPLADNPLLQEPLSQLIETGQPLMDVRMGDRHLLDIPISSSSNSLAMSVFTDAVNAFVNANGSYQSEPASEEILQPLRSGDYLEIRFADSVNLPSNQAASPKTVKQVLIPLTDPTTVQHTGGWGNFYYNAPLENAANRWTVCVGSPPDQQFFTSLRKRAQQLK